MSGYADPETLVGAWLHDTLGIKVWDDPNPPAYQRYTSPLTHLIRAKGGQEMALTLDEVLLDCDVYAAVADHARDTAQQIWAAMTLQLPKHTFGNGVFVKLSKAFMRPCWTPDPKWYRRSATYRLILHGLVP